MHTLAEFLGYRWCIFINNDTTGRTLDLRTLPVFFSTENAVRDMIRQCSTLNPKLRLDPARRIFSNGEWNVARAARIKNDVPIATPAEIALFNRTIKLPEELCILLQNP